MNNWLDSVRRLFQQRRLPSQPVSSKVGFGDRASIKTTPMTTARGLAGRIGHVFGQTTPSITRVEVIGTPTEDYAVNIFFDDLGKGYWFADDLVEFMDHSPGSEIRLRGIDAKWVRNDEGGWDESKDSPH